MFLSVISDVLLLRPRLQPQLLQLAILIIPHKKSCHVPDHPSSWKFGGSEDTSRSMECWNRMEGIHLRNLINFHKYFEHSNIFSRNF